MIPINLPTRNLLIDFSHPLVSGDLRSNRKTICTIWEKLDDGTRLRLQENEAHCSIKDNFSKAEGRKLALARTLCQHDDGNRRDSYTGQPFQTFSCQKCGSRLDHFGTLKLTKEEREKIWLEYFSTVRHKHVSTS